MDYFKNIIKNDMLIENLKHIQHMLNPYHIHEHKDEHKDEIPLAEAKLVESDNPSL